MKENPVLSNYVLPMPPVDGWMANEELHQLYYWASQFKSILEVGCWKGKSTHALLSGTSGKVIVVDHFQGTRGKEDAAHIPDPDNNRIYEEFIENVGMNEKLSTIRLDSLTAAALFKPRSIEMIFLDGDHEYEAVKADLAAWLPVCSEFICGHDYCQDGVRRAVQESGLKYNVAKTCCDLWYAEVPNAGAC